MPLIVFIVVSLFFFLVLESGWSTVKKCGFGPKIWFGGEENLSMPYPPGKRDSPPPTKRSAG